MAKRLREGVRWIDGTGVNAYLLRDSGTTTLVDAGTVFDADRIAAAIEATGTDGIDRILVTHYDADHVGAIGRLPTDAPIYIGRGDAGHLSGDERPPWRSLKGLTQRLSGPLVPDIPGLRDRLVAVDNGDEIGGFDAYHTPGHTPGHTVYVHEKRQAAFLGDLVIERNGSLRPAPWFLCRDIGRLRDSLRTLADRAPPFEAAAMGHGLPFSSDGRKRLRTLAESVR